MLSDINKILSKTELCVLADKCRTDKGKHGYTRVYYELFAPIRNNSINILEIGVRRGASLKLWNEFFPSAFVCGIDVVSNKIENCYTADQGDKTQVLEALNSFGNRKFDIIIDDGSHMQKDQQVSFGILFPFVKFCGYYIIEDVASRKRLLNGDYWGQNKKATDSTDLMFTKYIKTGKLNSYYLSYMQCKELENCIDDAFIYDESNHNNSPVSGTSKLVVLRHN